MATLSSSFLEKLDEFIHQEGRIVTYKWFSLKTGVSVTSAKHALELFVKHCRSGKVDYTVHVTYLVIGSETKPDGKKASHVCIVDEDQVEAVKSNLSAAGSSHVYSVQKAKIKDSSVLYAADVDLRCEKWQTSNRFSTIHCPAAVRGKRASAAAAPAKPAPPVAEVKTKAAPTPAPSTQESKELSSSAPTGKVAAAASSTGKTASRGKQPSAASFFGAAADRKKTVKSDSKAVAKEEKPVDSTATAAADETTSSEVGTKEKKGKGASAATSAASSKTKSFFGERLPKKKEAPAAKEEAPPSDDAPSESVATETGVSQEKPAKTTKVTAKAKPAAKGKKEAKSAKSTTATEPTDQPVQLSHDLFDAECDSDDSDKDEVPKGPSPKKRPASKVKKASATDLSDLYDAECESDEDKKPAKKARGRPKKEQKADSKPATKPKKQAEKAGSQPTLKRTRKNSDFLEDKGDAAAPVSESKPVPKSPPVPTGPRRKRVKKLVAKTHVNEAGEFVTEKVYETDSTDATDEDVAPAAKRPKIAFPKPSAAGGSSATAKAGAKPAESKKAAGKPKQANLMSFFKK